MPSTATVSNSEQSGERSVGGILVHILALFTAFVGPAVVYAVSGNDFTRENARRAINWHVTVIVLAVVAFVTSFIGSDEVTINGEPTELFAVPSPLDTIFTFIGVPLLLATVVAVFATFGFAVVATLKAVSGSAWSYPGAIDIIGRF